MICPQCRNEDVRYSAATSQVSCARCGYYGIPLRTGREKRAKPGKAKAAEKREPKKKIKKAAYHIHLRRRKKFRR